MNSRPWDGIEVVDAHAHLNERLVPRLLAAMADSGVSAAFVVAAGVVSPEELSRNLITEGPGWDRDADNRGLLAAIAGRPELSAFYYVNPRRAPDDSDRELVRRCAGVKFAPGVHGVGHTDPRVQAYVDLAAAHALPVYSHCVGNGALSVAEFARLARRNPGVDFVLGHGGRGNFDLLAAGEVKGLENVLFETSGAFDHVVREAVATLGADRVVFGSEFPVQHPLVELTKLGLVCAEADLPAVLGGNIQRITRKAGPDG